MDARTLKQLALVIVALVSTAVATGAGIAIDVSLPGTRIRLNDPADPAARRTYAALRDGDRSLPLPDPRVTGATIRIGRVGTGDVTVLDLPASGWGGGTTPRQDYKFKSKSGPVVAARIIAGHSVRFTARGAGAYPLGGTPQGSVGVIVEVGGVRFCGVFGGIITKDDGAAFRARRAPAPVGCPLLGSTTTTTTTSTSTTTTTMFVPCVTTGVSFSCTCGGGGLTCFIESCPNPNTCSDVRSFCVSQCGADRGNCETAICRDCTTGDMCQ